MHSFHLLFIIPVQLWYPYNWRFLNAGNKKGHKNPFPASAVLRAFMAFESALILAENRPPVFRLGRFSSSVQEQMIYTASVVCVSGFPT
jgi:hypothetical protein